MGERMSRGGRVVRVVVATPSRIGIGDASHGHGRGHAPVSGLPRYSMLLQRPIVYRGSSCRLSGSMVAMSLAAPGPPPPAAAAEAAAAADAAMDGSGRMARGPGATRPPVLLGPLRAARYDRMTLATAFWRYRRAMGMPVRRAWSSATFAIMFDTCIMIMIE